MEILGYIAALIIGISLGLIGGGGSILTVPALVYLLGISPVIATAYSLFIVGITSLAGSYTYFKKQLISFKTALVFGAPSILAVYLTRAYVVPAIPDKIAQFGALAITKDIFLMVVFAILMVFASFSMIRKNGIKKAKSANSPSNGQTFNYPLILLEGLVVGGLTGLVGAGGGFLIIPALVLLSKLDMKMAVGTSLLIISAKSLIGFLGDVANYQIDWVFLGIFSSISIVGIVIGSFLSNKVSADKLKSAFGWFVLFMGIYILSAELLF